MSERNTLKKEKLRVQKVSKHPKSWTLDEIQLDQSDFIERKVRDVDIVKFSEVTGDKNPLHLDIDFARKTIFKGCVAHGMLSAGYISAVFGMKLPGPGAIYISQTLFFRAPVKVGDKVKATVTVVEKMPEKKRIRFSTACTVNGKTVLEGEAILQLSQ